MSERLYYTDAYLQEFEAAIQAKRAYGNQVAVELDKTCFCPMSGGQPNDRGWLNGIQVFDVIDEDGSLLHLLEKDGLELGQGVRGKIDWERRFDHMQQHTGQHLLSQAFLHILGAETNSFHLGSETSTIDLSREGLGPEEIDSVEDLANQVIFENRLVHIHVVESEKQTQLPLRTQSARQGWLRIIEIADFDWSPCGGTHCRQTGEVGLIKVRRWEKTKKGVRVEFYCGWRVLRDYRWKNRVLYELSRLYSSNEHGVAKAAERNLSREQDLRKRLARMEDTLLAAKAERFLRQSTERNGIQVVCDILEEEESQNAKELARRIVEGDSKRVVLLGIRGKRPSLLFTCSDDFPHDMREWIRMVAPCIQGRGGGNAKQAQAGGSREEGLEQALNKAQELL